MAGVMNTDPRVEALESFKDWSNYLLVTTVAATGWPLDRCGSPWW